MTLTQILSAVVSNHKRQNQDGSDERDTVARTGVSLAIDDITKFHDFEGLKTSVDLTISAEGAYVDLPDGLLKIFEVRFMDGLQSRKMSLKNREIVTRDFPDLDTMSSSFPALCYQEGSRLYIAPRTSIDASIRVRYSTAPSFADDDSELSPVLQGSDRYLIEWATGWVFQSLQLYQESNMWFQRAGGSLSSMIQLDMRKPGQDNVMEPVGLYPSTLRDPLDPFNFQPNSVPY